MAWSGEGGEPTESWRGLEGLLRVSGEGGACGRLMGWTFIFMTFLVLFYCILFFCLVGFGMDYLFASSRRGYGSDGGGVIGFAHQDRAVLA